MATTVRVTHVCGTATYKAGDPPPEGYLEWHEWAATQHQAGLRQAMCRSCCRWYYPQERDPVLDAAGVVRCLACAAIRAARETEGR